MDCDAYRDQMLDVLYGEAAEPARRAVASHHATCAACAEEYGALRGLRRELSSWTLPASQARRVPTARLPWIGLAAAAALLIGVGALAAAGGAELRHDAQGWAFILGHPAAAEGGLQARLEAQEARHEADMREIRARMTTSAPSTPDEARVLAAAQELVARSERRQDQRLREAFLELNDRADTQRRVDLATMGTRVNELESSTGLRDARMNQLMGRVLLASQEK